MEVKTMLKRRRPSLKEVVGDDVYSVWVDMLKRLVPEGRTHRLAPLIASMLRYTMVIAEEKLVDYPEEDTVAYMLGMAYEDSDPGNDIDLVTPLVITLFKDAKVKWERTNSKGVDYSIAEWAVREFIGWTYMPWEEI
jgi:hypothetical protein